MDTGVAEKLEGFDIVADAAAGSSFRFDKETERATAGDSLEAKRAGAGERVDDTGAVEGGAQSAWVRMLKMLSRARSDVGRVSRPSGVRMVRPLSVPPTIRMGVDLASRRRNAMGRHGRRIRP